MQTESKSSWYSGWTSYAANAWESAADFMEKNPAVKNGIAIAAVALIAEKYGKGVDKQINHIKYVTIYESAQRIENLVYNFSIICGESAARELLDNINECFEVFKQLEWEEIDESEIKEQIETQLIKRITSTINKIFQQEDASGKSSRNLWKRGGIRMAKIGSQYFADKYVEGKFANEIKKFLPEKTEFYLLQSQAKKGQKAQKNPEFYHFVPEEKDLRRKERRARKLHNCYLIQFGKLTKEYVSEGFDQLDVILEGNYGIKNASSKKQERDSILSNMYAFAKAARAVYSISAQVFSSVCSGVNDLNSLGFGNETPNQYFERTGESLIDIARI